MNEDIEKCLEILKNGGIILYPTDTIWGLGCDATNESAVQRIYKIKKRNESKNLLILLDQPEKLLQYIVEVPDIAWDLIELTTKPLTIIYQSAKNLAMNLIADDGTIGVRITDDEFCRKLIARFKKPIVSTSANISGKPSPAFFNEIEDEIRSQADYVVQYRQEDNKPATPSSIIKLGIGGEIKIIRE